MTALTDLLADAKNGGRNVDHWVEQARREGHSINRATVYKYLDGRGAKNPTEAVLQGLAFVFGLDVRILRTAVGKPAGELGKWEPTAEAARLRQDQRDALDLLIKAIVKGGAEDAERSAATKTPDPGPVNPGLSVVPDRLDDDVAADQDDDPDLASGEVEEPEHP